MKKYILKICFNIINKLLTPIIMSKSIDNIIRDKVLPSIGFNNFVPIIKTSSPNVNNVLYSIEFPDNTTLDFKIEYLGNRVEYYFNGTTIIRMDMLNDILTKLITQLNKYNTLIEQHFIIQIEENRKIH
jgi:hypothetical protein